MVTKLIFLILLAFALADIDVKIAGKVVKDDSNLTITLSGIAVSSFTSTDLNLFKLSDATLKIAIQNHSGQTPLEVYLTNTVPSPPQKDYYKENGWQEVMTKLTPKSGSVLNMTSKLRRFDEIFFFSNDSVYFTYFSDKIDRTETVESALASTWFTDDLILSDLNNNLLVNHDVSIEDMSGDFVLFNYTSKWGVGNELKMSQMVNGSSTESNVLVYPAGAVIAELRATNNTILVELEYELSLFGTVIAVYADSNISTGVNVRALDIADVMKAANTTNNIVTKEIFRIQFYSDAYVLLSSIK